MDIKSKFACILTLNHYMFMIKLIKLMYTFKILLFRLFHTAMSNVHI